MVFLRRIDDGSSHESRNAMRRSGYRGGLSIGALLVAFLFAFPASTNYRLKGYGFGGGGEENMTSAGYGMDGLAGEAGAGNLSGSSYGIGAGLMFEQQANAPLAPTFANPGSYYDRLHLTLATGGNPTDAKFAVAISTDDFATTRYVQSDMTVGSSLGSEDYMTYVSWGGASGTDVIGLSANTTYKVKVKAMQGAFTETGYGPIASAATVSPQLSFDIDVSATDSESVPPFSVSFGNLVAGTVTDSPVRVWVDFSTNGNSGGKVFVSDSSGGLLSSSTSSLIAATSGDLSSMSSGYGLQGASVTQGSGGPFSIVSPYDLSGSVVGTVGTAAREIFASDNPLSTGRASFLLKAKVSTVTPAAGDYGDTLTLVTAANF